MQEHNQNAPKQGQNQSIKMAKLKAMVLHWQHSKSIMTAYDICQFLSENLGLEEYHEITQ